MMGTAKPVGTSFSCGDTLRDAVDMFQLAVGGETTWRARSFCCVFTCFIVSPLAGAVAQQTAKVLAGLVYVKLLSPGHPALFGALPFISDLRTGAMSDGSSPFPRC